MNIHLFSINSTHNELLKSTFEILKNFKGQFEFVLNTDYNFNINDKSFNSFESLFDICDDFRKNNKIPTTDIAILISPLTFEEYFSLYNSKSKNIFVCTDSFEEISTAETPYLIAHQVVENILQCVSSFNPLHAHKNSIGCLNDFCEEKQHLILKLRTADICTTCIKEFIKGGLSNATLFQSMKFLEELRSNFLLQDSYNKNLKPLLLKCVKNKKNFLEIYIGDQLISFTKTELFLYYLLCIGKDKGVDFNEEVYEKAELDGIGKVLNNKNTKVKIKSFVNIESVEIKQYFGYKNSNTFSKYKNSINSKLNETLGFNLAKFYIINKNSHDEIAIEKLVQEIKKEVENLKSEIKLLVKNKVKTNTRETVEEISKLEIKIKNLEKRIENPIQRAKAFPYVIQLFTRKDYKEYFKLDIK
jgi:hypothetical protein